MYRKFGKRLFDIVLSVFGLVVLSPVFLVVAVFVRVKLGSPVVFCQERPGYCGRIFRIFKFRTMSDKRDESGVLLSDEERLTSFGLSLRSASLDELPELWNILRGDMSVVGPRPLMVQYLPLYSAEQMRRHDVRPGLTGHAQINGRNAISWQERFLLDCWYVDNMSFWLDLKIICVTFARVVSRRGISSDTSATMEPFLGDD